MALLALILAVLKQHGIRRLSPARGARDAPGALHGGDARQHRACESGGLVVNDACDWWETRCDLVSICLGAISGTVSSFATATLGFVGAPWWSIIGSASALFSVG